MFKYVKKRFLQYSESSPLQKIQMMTKFISIPQCI